MNPNQLHAHPSGDLAYWPTETQRKAMRWDDDVRPPCPKCNCTLFVNGTCYGCDAPIPGTIPPEKPKEKP